MITFQEWIFKKNNTDDTPIKGSPGFSTREKNSLGGMVDVSFHNHADVAPKNFSDSARQSISDYVKSGYHDINNYLASITDDDFAIDDYQNPKTISFKTTDLLKKKIKDLLDSYTKDNTNKKNIIVWAGVPNEVALKLEKNKKGKLARFTSTTSDFNTALSFAELHGSKNQEYSVLKIIASPGTALSIAKLSASSENEILLRAGVHYNFISKEKSKTDKYVVIYSVKIEK